MSTRFTLSFTMDGSAFGDDDEEMTDQARYECARILQKVANQVIEGDTGRKILDINGNSCGSWSL